MKSFEFTALPIWTNLILFGLAATTVWIAGIRLSKYADGISDRLKIGKAIMGLVFLAAATELPELVTTITAALKGNAQLVLNNMFGGITMQTAVLAVADAYALHATLTFYPRKPTPALEGTLLILLLALLLSVSFLGDIALLWNVGIGAILLMIAYVLSISILRNYDTNSGWRPVEVPEEDGIIFSGKTGQELDQVSLSQLLWLCFAATLAIFAAGIFLVQLADTLAQQTKLGSSFIGVTLLAAATSLPELSTTIGAVRLGAFTMAISNIFGSNLIMLALLLPADVFYREGVLLAKVDRSATFALLSGIIVTAVYVAGLLLRKKKRVFGMGIDSLVVLIAYLGSLVVFYFLR